MWHWSSNHCPYSCAQNGSVQRRHRHIVKPRLSLLAQASMPSQYWFSAFQTTMFLINRMPISVLQNNSLFQILFRHPHDYKFFRTFGSVCWPNLCPFNRHKMNLYSKLCVFMGYNPDKKGYYCFHLPSSRTYIYRDVKFNENHFPFAYKPNSSSQTIRPTSPLFFGPFPTTSLES